MSFECLGCKKNYKDRQGYSGHVYCCSKFKEYQQQTLIMLRGSGSLGLSDELHCNDCDMEVDATGIETHSEQFHFSQNEASSSQLLTIVIPPVCIIFQ